MQTKFFATKKDLQTLTHYMMEELGFIFYEAYSRFDEPIRQVLPSSDLTDFNNLQGNILIRGWCKEFNYEPEFKKTISVKPELFKERTNILGPTLFQINEGGVMENNCLYPTRITAWTEKGAKWKSNYPDEQLEKINWAEMRRKSRQINRFIRVKNSKTKINSMSIMNNAYEEFENEKLRLWNWGEEISNGSPRIQIL